MSYNGSGTFQINTSGQPVVSGTAISSTAFNALTADLGTGLSTAICKDGQTTTTAPVPFAGGFIGFDGNFTLENTSDPTKIAKFSLSGFTTGNTRTFTLPDVSDTVVTLTSTGTLTNKTLTSPVLTTPAIGVATGTSLTLTGAAKSSYVQVTGAQPGNAGASRGLLDFFSGVTRHYSNGADTSTNGQYIFYSQRSDDSNSIAILQLSSTTATVTGTINATVGYQINGAAISQPTLGTPTATTSGTAINITGIPTTAKRVTVNLVGVSTNGSSNLLLQIGPSGGVETTGYLSRAAVGGTSTGSTAGFILTTTNLTSSSVVQGSIILTLENSSAHTTCAMGILNDSGTAGMYMSGGSKSTATAMTQLTLTTVNGTDTFDAGEINITYE